ncbi:MAG TPA: hypothetical protein VMT52_16045 [Planctomycetota bacterium]|nr:hypothetical protein [Planctomycetota bacterium]
MKRNKDEDEPAAGADNKDEDFAGATEELPQYDESGETEAHPTSMLDETSAADSSEGGDTEDVFVILPEGEGGDIPMVETEAVDEMDGTRTEAVPLQSMESLADIPLRSSNPLLGDTQEVEEQAVEETLELEEGAEDLEQMASDMDDEILRAPSRTAARDDDLLEEDTGDEVVSAPAGRHTAAAAPRSHSGLKAVLSLAAMALFAAGGYFAYVTWYVPSLGTGPAGGSLGSAAIGTPAGIDRGVDVPAGEDTSVASASPVDPDVAEGAQAASREAFREKLLLAVELGFGGEVSNE